LTSTNVRTLNPARSKLVSGLAVALALTALLIAGCSEPATPVSPSPNGSATYLNRDLVADSPVSHHAAAHDDKGYIDGWFNGTDVRLHYTKSYFCAEPPASGAESECVIGADAEVPPRPGQMRKIYAIAAVGFLPDFATLACAPGSPCLNHPLMIDASRVGGREDGPGLPHSHIVEEHGGGWRETVNIRVFNLDVWNQIAAAKSLAKVRELQGDPAVGRPGIISADTPTNIFFFIASWRKD
jgi:hypothetical protein